MANLSSTRYSSLVMIDASLSRVGAWDAGENPEAVAPMQRAFVGGEELCLHLAEGSAAVKPCLHDDVEAVWRSPADWRVHEAFFSDLDRDGVQELALLVWRAFKPWPVDRFMPNKGRIESFQDAQGDSCHLILVSLESGTPREIWAGSALAKPIHSLTAADLDSDGLQELAAIESTYDSDSASGAIVVWQWRGFGFSLVDRMEGSYTSLQAVKVGSSVFLIAPFE